MKSIFWATFQSNACLNLIHLPSSLNSKLAPNLWFLLQDLFGGESGHMVDLVALPSNAQCDCQGSPLPFFAPHIVQGACGVNIFAQNPDLLQASKALFANAYVFPPIVLVTQVLRFLASYSLSCTFVVPDVKPRQSWWPVLGACCIRSLLLAKCAEIGPLLVPTKTGFSFSWKLPWDLWVFQL